MNDEEDLSLDLALVKQRVRESAVLQRQIKTLNKALEANKKELRALVEYEGETDESGHKVFSLGENIEGIGRLVLQRRKSRPLDADAAERILKSIVIDEEFGRTLWHDCIEMVPVLDEDKVMAAHYEDLLTEEQIDEMFPEVVTWAYTMTK